MGRGSHLIHHLADQIAIFENRKDPPPLPRSERTKNVIEECFDKLWDEGDNWPTRREFFALVCAELKTQECPLITYRHFVRILEDTALDEYFPPMRRRRKRRTRELARASDKKVDKNNEHRNEHFSRTPLARLHRRIGCMRSKRARQRKWRARLEDQNARRTDSDVGRFSRLLGRMTHDLFRRLN
jgi:hypothetical protein